MNTILKYFAAVMVMCVTIFTGQAKTIDVNVSKVKGDLPMQLRKYCAQATYNDTVILNFGKGTYTIDATIECRGHVIIKGKNSKQSKIVFNQGHSRNGQKAYISDAFFKFHGTPSHPISVTISDISFDIKRHDGIWWKDGERYAVKIYHADGVNVHDVDSYLENAYITNFDLHVCSNVSFTDNVITNYNNCETGGCLWIRGEMHNVRVSGNKFYKYGKDETLAFFDNVVDNTRNYVRGIASRTDIIVENNEFHYGGYDRRDKDPKANCGMIFSLFTNDLKDSDRCTTSNFHLRNNKFYVSDVCTRCIFIGFSANDVHNDIYVENNQIVNNSVDRSRRYYHDDFTIQDESAAADTIHLIGNTVKNKNLVINNDGDNAYIFLHLYGGNVSLVGNKVTDEVTVNPHTGKYAGIRLVYCGSNDGTVTMRDNVFKGIGRLAHFSTSKGIDRFTLNARNNYFAGETRIYCDNIKLLNIDFTGNTFVSNSVNFFLNNFAAKGSVTFNNNDVTIKSGNGQFITGSSDKAKFDKLEIQNNVFRGVKGEQDLFRNVNRVNKRRVSHNSISR